MEMKRSMVHESDLNLKATELRLGLPGSDESHRNHSKSNKRASPEVSEESRLSTTGSSISEVHNGDQDDAPPAKTQVVGWPPVRSHRKNTLQRSRKPETEVTGSLVKVSVDGAAYLRKIDLKVYGSYSQLLKALEDMFKLTIGKYSEREGYNYNGSDYSPTYEDKDGDWMLVGDVPWEMFICSCKRLRIMKGSEDKN